MVRPSNRAGVPVFSRPNWKSWFLKAVDNPMLGASPILPAGHVLVPKCISPFKNVPEVITAASQEYSLASSQMMLFILLSATVNVSTPFSIISSPL